MPKILNYPRASFGKCLELADAADSLGGSCDSETCAESLDRKVSGSFRAIIASAQKFDLINYEKGTISVSDTYSLIKHAYSDEEKLDTLREAFLKPEVFSDLYERFVGNKLPIEMLEKILIREYDVEEREASRISKYFVDGLKEFGLLDEKDFVLALKNHKSGTNESNSFKEDLDKENNTNNSVGNESGEEKVGGNKGTYTIKILGPGLNSTIEINDQADIDILNATLKKVRKALDLDKEGSE